MLRVLHQCCGLTPIEPRRPHVEHKGGALGHGRTDNEAGEVGGEGGVDVVIGHMGEAELVGDVQAEKHEERAAQR